MIFSASLEGLWDEKNYNALQMMKKKFSMV